MAAIVGPGIKAQMDAAGDTPVTHEWNEKHGSSVVAFAWGKLGLYIASQDSGEWVVAGPLAGAA